MPVQTPSFFIPSSLSAGSGGKHPYETALNPPFVVEDLYVRGGFMCLPSIAIRNKIPLSSCKLGMLVYTPEDGGKIWQIESMVGSVITWVELELGGNYVGLDPIAITANSEIFIDPLRILPIVYDPTTGAPLANQGNVVVLDSTLTPQWTTLSSAGFTGVRLYKSYTTALLDAFNAPEENFTLELGRFIALLSLEVDIPDILVEAYSTDEMLDNNPYKFISTEYLLSDTGISELVDGSYVRTRRYSFLANMDNPTDNKIYWHIKYLANTEASKDSGGAIIQYRQPTLTICYMVFEP